MSRPAGSEDDNSDPRVIEIYPVLRGPLQGVSDVEAKQTPRGGIQLKDAAHIERKVGPAPS